MQNENLIAMATLLLPAVHGPRVQASIASDNQKVKYN